MKYIVLIITLIAITSCSQNSVIYYGTDEFLQFEAKSNLKKEDAWRIHVEYCKKYNKSIYRLLFFVIDGNYVFSDAFDLKFLSASTHGVWVNAMTGEIHVKNDGEFLSSKGCYWDKKFNRNNK